MRPPPSKTLGAWTVAGWETGAITLERTTSSTRQAMARALIALACIAAAFACVTGTPASLALVVWPVAGLLLVVAALAIPAAARDAVLAVRGVRLVVTRDEVRGTLVPRGLFHDVRAETVSARPEEVAEVAVRRAAHPPLELTTIEVVLVDGRRLLGPEVAVPAGASSPLDPVARAMGEVLKH